MSVAGGWEPASEDSAFWICELSFGGAFLAAAACFPFRSFRWALILGRGSGLVVVDLEAVTSFGGSLGAVRSFHAGLTLGAAPDRVAVMLIKSRS